MWVDKPKEVSSVTSGMGEFRRMQLVDGTPSDLEGIARKREAIAAHDSRKEHDYMTIAFAAGILILMCVMALIILSKVDLGDLLGGGGGGGGGITVTIAHFAGVML